MEWRFNDGGRAAAGFPGHTGDCACRSIAIATERPYQEVREALNGENDTSTIRHYLEAQGWRWIPTARIHSPRRRHLKARELPPGRLIVSLSHHLTAVIDGVIHDNHDPSVNETRIVYGYFERR